MDTTQCMSEVLEYFALHLIDSLLDTSSLLPPDPQLTCKAI